MLHNIFFSPSGTTKKTVDVISSAIGMEHINHDITVKAVDIHLDFSDDLVLFAVPVYAGRIPPIAADRISAVKGGGQKAIVIVVYGNRDYDDALAELCDITIAQGFEIVAAGAFIGEHCIFPKVANDRPDGEDILKIQNFVKDVKETLCSGSKLDISKVKGKRPYKKIAGVPLHPKVDKKLCNSCGTCAKECPADAIDVNNPRLTDDTKCITCCRCINICPQNARKLGGLLYKLAGWKFVKDNSRRLEPEWFIVPE